MGGGVYDDGGDEIGINFHAPGTSFVQQDMFPEANRWEK